MRVQHFRRQYRGVWRYLSRLAVVVVCLELVLMVMIAQRAEASPLPATAVHGEKLAS